MSLVTKHCAVNHGSRPSSGVVNATPSTLAACGAGARPAFGYIIIDRAVADGKGAAVVNART